MGNLSSHTHEPLEHGFQRSGKFGDIKNGKSASFRISKKSPKKMDRLRRSFRDSFRRRKERIPESSKPHQWQADEDAVRSAACSFAVKYLGCVEVFESRGMQICEEALKVLRDSRRRPVRGLLHISGDGLRVVDGETKGLIVDQTIEKVSFCAPDRHHERGFSYICRDGTTRRWMCHGFLACKVSGERLSHAVGCAFAVCLERKQRRDKECGVTMTFDTKNSIFTRTGSFRQQTLTERMVNSERGIDVGPANLQPQAKPFNPFAIERPHATPSMLERQGSFRAFSTIGSQSPFKRQMSLRINDLPSNAERQKAFLSTANGAPNAVSANRFQNVSPIPEIIAEKKSFDTDAANAAGTVDSVGQLCQELRQGLTLLTESDTLLGTSDDLNFNNNLSINQNIITAEQAAQKQASSITSRRTISPHAGFTSVTSNNTSSGISTFQSPMQSATEISSVSSTLATVSTTAKLASTYSPLPTYNFNIGGTNAISIDAATPLPNADQWLGEVVKRTSPTLGKIPIESPDNAEALGAGSAEDPFDAEWAVGVTLPVPGAAALAEKQPPVTHLHSTNPFISPINPPSQSFQVEL